MLRRCQPFLLILFVLFLGLPCAADEDLRLPRVVVASGGPYISRDLKIQRFDDVIQIPGNYLRQPLAMVCTNGTATAPGFSWVRVFLMPDKTDQDYQFSSEPLGRLLVTDKAFFDTAQIYLDLTGQFKPGRNRILIEGAGRVGASYTWEMRSIAAPILYMPQTSSTVSGAWLQIAGSGFSLRPAENTVQLGPVVLPVGESNSNYLRVYVPKGFPAGTYDLSVSIRQYRSRVVRLQVVSPKAQQ